MLSLCTSPITVAQLCPNNHSSSCLPSRGPCNESGGSSVAGTARLGALVAPHISHCSSGTEEGLAGCASWFWVWQVSQRLWDLPRWNRRGQPGLPACMGEVPLHFQCISLPWRLELMPRNTELLRLDAWRDRGAWTLTDAFLNPFLDFCRYCPQYVQWLIKRKNLRFCYHLWKSGLVATRAEALPNFRALCPATCGWALWRWQPWPGPCALATGTRRQLPRFGVAAVWQPDISLFWGWCCGCSLKPPFRLWCLLYYNREKWLSCLPAISSVVSF